MKKERTKRPRCNWKEIFQTTMSAAAFAEANVPESAREILNTGRTNKEAVLFAIQAEKVPPGAVEYAADLCRRLDCGLEVLLVYSEPKKKPGDPAADRLENSLRKTGDIPATLHAAYGPLPEVVQKFMKERRRIISVVLDHSQEQPAGRGWRTRKERTWWQELSCPVVFIPAHA